LILQIKLLKSVIQDLKNFHKGYYHTKSYALILFFTLLLIAFNYYFDLEDAYIDHFRGTGLRIPLFFLYHSLAYFGVVVILLLSQKQFQLSSKGVVKALLGVLILSIYRSSYPFFSEFLFHGNIPYRLYAKLLNNLHGWITLCLLLILMKLLFDRKESFGLYGMRKTSLASLRPYGYLLLFMLPLIFFASLHESFHNYYPVYQKSQGNVFSQDKGIHEAYAILLYEFSYLGNFLNIELFFRGFLVIGMAKLMGKNAVLPMAATYVVLHFGKPMGEAISSLFGGYLLGILAYYGKNIWGGVFIHGGIALLMELFAFLNHP
jgi:hypothetical protein